VPGWSQQLSPGQVGLMLSGEELSSGFPLHC